MFSTVTIPINSSVIPVDTRLIPKVLYLPTVSTNSGRFLLFKDYYGTSSNSSFTVSTTGTDLLDDVTTRYTFSNAYGSMSFIADGLRSWRTLSLYNGDLTPITAPSLSPSPGMRYSFLAANYSGGSTVTNIGSNSAIGAGTVVKNSFTSASPGFITNIRASQYVLGASFTGLRTVIMICKVRDAASAYFLDGRPGMASGYMYIGGNGGDWNGATYYKDAVLTSLPTTLPAPLSDNLWHHNTLITTSAFTSAMTFGNRFSFNEGMGCDFGEIMVFSQVLTLQQVKDNYNFFASRFGLTPVS